MVEYNHPYVLLQDADGYLCRMVQQTGKGEAQRLLDIAKSTYNSIPLEERPVLTKKSETITADDIYLSQENGDVTSFGANHVPQMQGGTEHSFSSGVVSNMSPSLDRSEENGPDINEDIDDSETSSLLTKQLEATPCRSSHSIDSSPEDEPPTETSTLHQHTSEATYPKEESNEVSETTELLNGDHTDQ